MKRWRCVNHNYSAGKCELGLDKCESLVPAVDITVSAFGPPRENCLCWGSRQEHGRVAVKVQHPWKVRYLARIRTHNALLIGKFNPHKGIFLANNEGERVGPIRELDQRWSLSPWTRLHCTLLWMCYTAGELLPVGAISGGFLPDGSNTYISRVTRRGWLIFGYHNTEAELTFYECYGAHTKTSMEIPMSGHGLAPNRRALGFIVNYFTENNVQRRLEQGNDMQCSLVIA